MEVVRFGGTVKKDGRGLGRPMMTTSPSQTRIERGRGGGRRETTVYKARPGAGSVMIQIISQEVVWRLCV